MDHQFEWSHRRLDAWKIAMDLAVKVSEELRKFPPYELYGLCAQLRDASVSVPTNIAEGAARPSKREYYRFLGISRASLSEMDTELELAKRLGYISTDSEVFPLLTRASYLLDGLMKHVKSKIEHPRAGKR
ncbi:MAG: four helix bundle protein [Bacteroidia bacterium]|nr:four helix bundle protein [Bacteroidia bacterium]